MPKRLLIAVLAVLLGLGLAAAAQAELSQEGTLRISFGGGFVPRALPRDHPAPVTVHLRGAISTTDGSHPPALQRVEVALNRNGRIATAGLPVCTAPLLQSTGTEAALAGCRPALVGRGRFRASLQFPNAPEVPATGPMLAFNGRYRGKSALFLHLYASTPVRFTFVVPLTVSRRHNGRFGDGPRRPHPDPCRRARLGHRNRPPPWPRVWLPRRPPQLRQRQLRRPRRLPRSDLLARPRQLLLRRRHPDRHHARPRLQGPLDELRARGRQRRPRPSPGGGPARAAGCARPAAPAARDRGRSRAPACPGR